jgi:hypothetical protein
MEERTRYAARYDGLNATSNAVDYAKFRSRSHDAVIRIYDAAGNVIETHEQAGDFKKWKRAPAFSVYGSVRRGLLSHSS